MLAAVACLARGDTRHMLFSFSSFYTTVPQFITVITDSCCRSVVRHEVQTAPVIALQDLQPHQDTERHEASKVSKPRSATTGAEQPFG